MRIAEREVTPWTVAALVVLGLAAFLVWRVLAAGGPLEVTVTNTSGSPLDPLVLVSDSGFRTSIPALRTDESATVRPRVGDGADSLVLIDAADRQYRILDSFKGNPGGQVTIIVRGTTPAGLKGRVVRASDNFVSGESALVRLDR